MSAITVKTNGQTLIVTSSVSAYGSQANADAASSAITFPQVVTSDYTIYYPDSANQAPVLTVTTLDGTALIAQTYVTGNGCGPYVVNPVPNGFQFAADAQVVDRAYTDEAYPESTMDRERSLTTITLTSGVLRGGYFTARTARKVANAVTRTGATAAGATPTVNRIGLWTVDANGGLTALVANTAHSATLWDTIATTYTTALAAAYTFVPGTRYYAGALCVTGATAPVICGAADGDSGLQAIAPRITGTLSGQTDLPATVASGSMSASTNRAFIAFSA